jgi:hypothetical protein
MEAQMKSKASLLIMLLTLTSLAAASDVFEYKIPPGWKFKDAAISKSGMKVLVLWQDLQLEFPVKHLAPSRLVIFDSDDRPVNDIIFEKIRWLRPTRDEKILLIEGENEKTEKVSVFDMSGNKISEFATQSRLPYPALRGRDIGLGYVPPGTPQNFIGPVSIIDGETGREKISYGPPSKGALSGFLPIGVDGNFVIASGATVFMRSYLHPETVIWTIRNIGGNVYTIGPVDDDLISIRYEVKNPKANYFLAGIALVEWKTGRIVFSRESNNPKNELWGILHSGLDIQMDAGDLLFSNFGQLTGIRVQKKNPMSDRWDEVKVNKYKISNWSKKQMHQLTSDGRHIYRVENGKVLIEKMKYEDETETPEK